MKLKDKITYFESDMSDRGEAVGDFITPIHRVLWKFEVDLPPPVFCGKGMNFLVTTSIMFLICGSIYVAFNSNEIIESLLKSFVVSCGVGIYDMIINAKRRNRLSLGSWEQYPPSDETNQNQSAQVNPCNPPDNPRIT
ncbi:DUF6404 family protein [Coraliomargarita sp. SDUM461003]|uniref:DUF6404 family protein n=1 Tax=Thalassobacterium maritimum TaxID=3041265 RepID=A0ABU1AZW2_9BACT|nr:DUF6404 family protein [Coraliomargarita sp. SDUM461003]MDQ8209700.1 DUF6404 family protein [Coraliomargarita sp. SDUM461003]